MAEVLKDADAAAHVGAGCDLFVRLLPIERTTPLGILDSAELSTRRMARQGTAEALGCH
jgi:hypothetical protein